MAKFFREEQKARTVFNAYTHHLLSWIPCTRVQRRVTLKTCM